VVTVGSVIVVSRVDGDGVKFAVVDR